MENYKAVGRIIGSPLNGLCERMCINVDCVLDACRARRDSQNATVILTDITQGATPPFTFVGAVGLGGSQFDVTSTCSAQNGCSRISGTLHVPVVATFTDANGMCCHGNAVISMSRDIVLRLPQNTNIDYRIEGDGGLICVSGAFLSDTAVSLTFCIVETYRVIRRADIIVPTYGYAVFPDCRECDGCAALMNALLGEENGT